MSAEKMPAVAVVENDAALLRAIGRLLDAGGYKPVLFNSAEEYLNRSEAIDGECLVLDINLGGMSGLDLQKRLCEEGVPPPIIFITGQSDIPSFGRAIGSGCVAYLYKPFDPGYLLKLIRGVVPTH